MFHVRVSVTGESATARFASGLFGYFPNQAAMKDFRRRFDSFLPALPYACADAKATFEFVTMEPPSVAYWTLAHRARIAQQNGIKPVRSLHAKCTDTAGLSMFARLLAGLIGALATFFGSPQPRSHLRIDSSLFLAKDGFPRYAAVRLFVEETRSFDNSPILVGPFPSPGSFRKWELDLRVKMARLRAGFEPEISGGRILSPTTDSVKNFMTGAIDRAMEEAA